MNAVYDPTVYRQFLERDFTYLNGFRRNVARYGSRLAVADPASDHRMTYRQLGDRVDRVAAGLLATGAGPGDVVAYQLFNGPEFAELYLATQAAGLVGSPVNFRLAAGEIAYVLDIPRPTVFVYDTELSATLRDALSHTSHRPAVIVAVGAGEPVHAPDTTVIRYRDVLAEQPIRLPAPDRTVWDETTRLYTSGTTGMPKAVPLNSMIEVFSAHDVIMHFPMTPDDVTLNMTPWFHRGGLYSGGPNPMFYVGGQVVPVRTFDPGRTLDIVAEHGVTFLIGAPTNLALLAAAQQDRARDLSSLRGIVTMGAPLERDSALQYQQVLHPRLFNGYGSTEGFWNTFLRPADLPAHAGSAGRSCTDDDVRVVRLYDERLGNPDDTIATDGSEVGEVIVRSPKSSAGYFGAEDQQQQKFHNGWLYVGDLATWDSEEFVTIVGRKDDMLVSGGENVHPVQVEEAINEHPQVLDSLVVGVPDPKWGRMVVAYVVAGQPALSVDELDDFCRRHARLSRFKRPRAYQFVSSLPISATGKKLHHQAASAATDEFARGCFVKPTPIDARTSQ